PLGTIDPLGPIGPTALPVSLPEFKDEVYADNQQGPNGPPRPGIESQNETVYEDGSVTLLIIAQSNAGPTVNTVLIVSGIPAGWTVVPNGGVYDPSSGTITYTGTGTFTATPTFSPPADSDADLPDLTLT